VSERDLRDLATRAGLLSDWIDADGKQQRVSTGSLQALLDALGYPCRSAAELKESGARLDEQASDTLAPLITAIAGAPIILSLRPKAAKAEIRFESGAEETRALHPAGEGSVTLGAVDESGYHRLIIDGRETTLAVAPPRCVTFGDIAPGEKMWGLSVQLYGLRREGDFGMGDAGALAEFAGVAARQGADAVAISPAHSLFPADPARFAPYSPSSRLFLNALHADPATVFPADRTAAQAAAQQTAPSAEDISLIDWGAAGRRKYAALRSLYEDFARAELSENPEGPVAGDFQAFMREGGDYLFQHALFEAAQKKWLDADPPRWNWTDWPAEWRDPHSETLKRFAAEQSHEIQFSLFLQWIADRSFAAAQVRAKDAGMRIGIITDLAVGMDRGGSHAWSRQDDVLLKLSIGAPPDKINGQGQNWGLTAFSPQALARTGYEPFLATLRAALRHAGGVRIDHVMSLMRLWVIPEGANSLAGAYLLYPLSDLLNLVALESYRHRAVVIGEDLGTVPPEFRVRLAERGMAGMDVLWFERDQHGGFRSPQDWRSYAVGMTTTHDLPTVAGWWSGTEIDARAACGFVADVQAECEARKQDRARLWDTFENENVTDKKAPPADQPQEAVDAAIAFVAGAASPLSLIPVEDILGLAEQPNLPGTVDEHPNWRRRFEKPAADMLQAPDAQGRLAILRKRRK
jgi:4-alpha-glucanotransferase